MDTATSALAIVDDGMASISALFIFPEERKPRRAFRWLDDDQSGGAIACGEWS